MLRVVSFVPSLTEVLCMVGGKSMLIGRNHEDDYPEDIRDRPILTSQKTVFTTSADVDKQVSESISQGLSLYNIDEDLLKKLAPDVILTQDLCSVCAIDLRTVERIAKTMNPSPKIVSLNPENLEEVIDSLRVVGEAVGQKEASQQEIQKLHDRIKHAKEVASKYSANGKKKILFIEWTDPIFIGGHWTPQIIEMAGGEHGLNPTKPHGETVKAGPSFRVEPEKAVEYDPDIVIICPCGLDLEAAKRETRLIAQKDWWKELHKKTRRTVLVDGNHMFNRPGPRLVDALEWLVGYIHNEPSIIPDGFLYEEWIE